jgi:hypothetical protein
LPWIAGWPWQSTKDQSYRPSYKALFDQSRQALTIFLKEFGRRGSRPSGAATPALQKLAALDD